MLGVTYCPRWCNSACNNTLSEAQGQLFSHFRRDDHSTGYNPTKLWIAVALEHVRCIWPHCRERICTIGPMPMMLKGPFTNNSGA